MADNNKTEQPTTKRRIKAREQGQVPRSRELPSVFALASVVGVTMLMAPSAITHWAALYRETLHVAATEDIDTSGPVLFWCHAEIMRWIAPIFLAGLVTAVLGGLVQGGINIASEAFTPNLERLNPANKLGQIFSPVGLSDLLKSMLPFGVILCIATNSIQSNWQTIMHASNLDLHGFSEIVGSLIFTLAWKSGLVLLLWSILDYVLVRRKLESDLKMTKEEVRQEHKETDGNPVIKQRVRNIRRAMRRAQSLKAAATATVIVTNPTHYAIALRYEAEMEAPVVVAKGLDLVAEKIKKIAYDSGIMLIENKPLAQALYKSVEVGDSIPSKLYQAVAEILVVVFRAQAEVRQREAERRSRNASGQEVAISQANPNA
jgi:flagellar biosynthetic protein FlhB